MTAGAEIWVPTVIGVVLGALLSAFIMYLVQVSRRQDQVDKCLREMPEKYTLREDFVRWTTKIDKKLHDMFTLLDRRLGRRPRHSDPEGDEGDV